MTIIEQHSQSDLAANSARYLPKITIEHDNEFSTKGNFDKKRKRNAK